jgi:hypothetical protein
LLLPIARFSPGFFGARAVLMRPHDGAVEHRVFVVGINHQQGKNAVPHAAFGSATVSPVRVVPIAEAFRKIAPGNAGSIAVEHGIDEKAVIRRRYADRTRPSRQFVLDPVPLVIAESMVAHWSAFDEADTLRIEEFTAPEAPLPDLTTGPS